MSIHFPLSRRLLPVGSTPQPNRQQRRAEARQKRYLQGPSTPKAARPTPARTPEPEPPQPLLPKLSRAPAPKPRPAKNTTPRRSSRFLPKALLFAAALSAGGASMTAFESEAEAQPRRRSTLRTSDLTLKGSVAARPLVLIGALAMLSLLPFVIIMVTSFVKISVVLSIIRSALGTQQIPPTQVITGMSIILTVYIMTPVGLEIYKRSESLIQQRNPGQTLVSAETVDLVFQAITQARDPVKGFLKRHSHKKDQAMFYGMAKRLRKPEDRSGVGPDDFMIMVPSFVISELKEAFQIGFIIFVPFLVIDMIVSNILMALGMQMLSPTTISLPFKLLLFVMIDGWYLITKGLITGYI